MKLEDVRENMVFYNHFNPTTTFTVIKVKFRNGDYIVDLVDRNGGMIKNHYLNNSVLLSPTYYYPEFKDTEVPEIEWV